MCNCKIRTKSLALRQFRICKAISEKKQHINGQDPSEQVYKIWRKNFQELLSKHVFGVGSFFEAAPCIYTPVANFL